jgi:hypothetical protein
MPEYPLINFLSKREPLSGESPTSHPVNGSCTQNTSGLRLRREFFGNGGGGGRLLHMT